MGTPSPSVVPDSAPTDDRRLVICVPVVNDWTSVFLLVERIDVVAQRLRLPVSVLLIDDGSSELPPNCNPILPTAIQAIEVLQLRRNLGHQRALALALTFIHAIHPSQFVVVMDADGEDIPDDIEALVNCCRENGCRKIIFAKRAKRSEGQTFRAGYAPYRVIHFILTGYGVELQSRSMGGFLPIRDWQYFVVRHWRLNGLRLWICWLRAQSLCARSELKAVSSQTARHLHSRTGPGSRSGHRWHDAVSTCRQGPALDLLGARPSTCEADRASDCRVFITLRGTTDCGSRHRI
jgi:glycosyltransferase involved in cell wall biosynthesis